MKIDIISDVVCPWCIVGYKQLEHALEKTGIDAQIQSNIDNNEVVLPMLSPVLEYIFIEPTVF